MLMKRNLFIIIAAAIVAGAAIYFLAVKYGKRPAAPVEIVKRFPFSEENALKEWEEKIFKGKVLYRISAQDHESFVLATSEGTASALYYKIKLDMKKRPVIRWKWDARKFPLKGGQEDLKDVKKDDFAARVYVIFPAIFFTNSKAIEYIWAENTPEETVAPSPYSKNLQRIVAECGKKEGVEWVSKERDIYKDYVTAFKEEPKYNIGAVAFMTDADSTQSSAEAFYDDIELGYKKEEAGK
jgi:hypothetical protein